MDYQGDADGNLLRMKSTYPFHPPSGTNSSDTARLELSRTLGIGSPSDCVKSFSNVKQTVLDRGGPRYGRPSDRFGPPTALFNHALAGLQYDLEHLEALTPPKETIPSVFELVSRSAGFFDDEEGREKVLREILKELLPGEIKWKEKMAGGAIIPDGVWFKGSAVYMIFELKNEPGLGGDPSLQCLAVYAKILQQKEVSPPSHLVGGPSTKLPRKQYSEFSSRSNLPVVLISIAGNRLEVSTAVFTDAVYADKLLSLELRLGPHGPDNVLRVARIFTAIKKCANQLSTLYGKLEALPNVVPGVMYPSPTADPPESTAEMIPQLEFLSKLDRMNGDSLVTVDEDNKRHGIYLAEMPYEASTGDTSVRLVLVKFTAKYNDAAHRLLAEHDPPLAPALYHCVRVIGGLYMVVMEYMSNAKPLHYFLLLSPRPPPPNADVVRRDVRKALDLLHGQDFVFGDLRQINVLYSSNDERAFLVDFDWVGKHKVDRYSPCLDTRLGLGVGKWDLMRKSDDDANLKKVMQWLSNESS